MDHLCPRWTQTRVWEDFNPAEEAPVGYNGNGPWMAFHHHPQRSGALEAIKAPGSLSVWKDDTEGEKKKKSDINIITSGGARTG